jgi:hypothetical protein
VRTVHGPGATAKQVHEIALASAMANSTVEGERIEF